jgi:chemotaxis response regulator CheB
VPKVLVACTDVAYCDRLLVSFQPHPEFQLCLAEDEGFATVALAIKIKPKLVVLELEPEPKRLVIAEAFKLLMPEVPVFVIASMTWELEKEMLSAGVDAVFDKDGDFTPVIENAKAAIAWQPTEPES